VRLATCTLTGTAKTRSIRTKSIVLWCHIGT
jgi:hypothetical protein